MLPQVDAWLVCALAVFLGTILQRLSGAGFGMIVAPVMTLMAPQWVPGTILLVGLLVGLGAFMGARDAIVLRDLPPGLIGRTAGAVIATLLATLVVGSPALPVVVGCVVLGAVALNLAGLKIAISRVTLLCAGCIAGIMGTLTGIGAPPMAILYSTVDARRSAATQNAFFGFGMLISITSLAIAGFIRAPQIALALSLAPIVPIGIFLSRPLVGRFEGGSIRPWALGLATISALTLIIESL